MKNKTLIVDEYTHLCFPTLEYTKELFQIITTQRSYLEQYLPWVENIQKEWHARGFLKEAMLLNKGGQRLTTLVIYKGQLAGAVSFVKIENRDKRAEIGYWLRADLQKQGIMARSCNRLVQYAFKGLHLNRLEMRIAASNRLSKKIPLRLNFQLEGILRDYQAQKNGTFEDVELYGLLNKDYLKIANGPKKK